MQELTFEQVEEVSGGVLPIGVHLAIYLAGQASNVYAWYKFAESMDTK